MHPILQTIIFMSHHLQTDMLVSRPGKMQNGKGHSLLKPTQWVHCSWCSKMQVVIHRGKNKIRKSHNFLTTFQNEVALVWANFRVFYLFHTSHSHLHLALHCICMTSDLPLSYRWHLRDSWCWCKPAPHQCRCTPGYSLRGHRLPRADIKEWRNTEMGNGKVRPKPERCSCIIILLYSETNFMNYWWHEHYLQIKIERPLSFQDKFYKCLSLKIVLMQRVHYS